MNSINIPNKNIFQAKLRKTVFSLIVFIVLYLATILISIALAISIAGLGIYIVMKFQSLITIAIAISFVGAGLLILYFLLKFIFKKNIDTPSTQIEIHRNTEAKLFELIDKVAAKTQSSRPKKVFLFDEVNARVDFDSPLLSLIFPTRKNLHIGLALMNSMTVSEFESILAHEFGHFSQDGMKLGSYIYHINKVLHDQLFDNSSINKLISDIGDSFVASWILTIGVGIIRAIQFVLSKLYAFVNKNYMALSREMEYEADSLAAIHSGIQATKSALLRLELASFSYQDTIEYFNKRLSDNLLTKDIFKLHSYVLMFLSSKHKISLKNGFPDVLIKDLNAYNYSKINITDQWASHPSIADRVRNIEKFKSSDNEISSLPAISILKHREKLSETITSKLFSTVTFEGEMNVISDAIFKKEYADEYNLYAFDDFFNNYYSLIDPDTQINPNSENPLDNKIFLQDPAQFYDETNLSLAKSLFGLKADIQLLEELSQNETQIRSFDYDGTKHKKKQIPLLISKLQKEIQIHEKSINSLNQNILNYCLKKAPETRFNKEFDEKLKLFTQLRKDLTILEEEYIKIGDQAQFLSITLNNEVIEVEQKKLKKLEQKWKDFISSFREDGSMAATLGPMLNAEFEKYIDSDRDFFNGRIYNESVIERFFLVMNNMPNLLNKISTIKKKELTQTMLKIMKS